MKNKRKLISQKYQNRKYTHMHAHSQIMILSSYWLTTLGCRVWLRYLVLLSQRKLVFPSQPNNYQLQIIFCLRIGICVHFPFSILEFCLFWTCTGPVHVVRVSMSSYVSVLWYLGDTFVLETSFLFLLFCTGHWVLRGGVWWSYPSWDWVV